jgi:SAM-dependent methyltransferase
VTNEHDVNRALSVEYVRRRALPDAAVLDFGCGDGAAVALLLEAGFDAFGVDVRWPGADYGNLEASELGKSGRLRYYENGERLPFDDDTFDVIFSDQVLEHVPDLEAAIDELERIARPGAVMYHQFPSRAVWRDGHIGIPFVHRFQPGRARFWYATVLRRAGLGVVKDERSPRRWASDMLDWLDRWAIYRRIDEVEALLGRNALVAHRELEYCHFRARERRFLRWLFRSNLRRPIEATFRRFGFEAIEVQLR